MDDALTIHRMHFAFTITYHYLFPQLTMGLAPLVVVFKSLALWKGDERYNRAVTTAAAFLLWRKKLFNARRMLWALMLSFPFPYIANTAGWMTAELGRQPWLVYGLMRTSGGFSPTVSSGNGLFTLIGFMGMYFVMGVLFLFLMWREVEHGPGFLGGHKSKTPPSAKILPEGAGA